MFAALFLLVGLPVAQGKDKRDKSKDKDKEYWAQMVEGRRFAIVDQADARVIDAKDGILLVKKDADRNGFYLPTGEGVVIKGRVSKAYHLLNDPSEAPQVPTVISFTISDDGSTITEVYSYAMGVTADRKFTYHWSGPAPN